MDYIELRCEKPQSEEQLEILIAELAELGFESFTEEEDHLLAYIPEKEFSDELLSGNAYLNELQETNGKLAIKTDQRAKLECGLGKQL